MRLRLKTKLVIAITALVFAVVMTLSTIYISQLVQQRIDEVYRTGDFVAHVVFNASREVMESDLASGNVNPSDPEDVRNTALDSLKTDQGLNALMDSIVGYSPVISSVSIADTNDRYLLHTNSESIGHQERPQEDFSAIRRGGFRRQLRVIFGQRQEYTLAIPILLNDQPLAAVRVNVNTVFIREELKPQLTRALTFSALAVLVSIILAAALSNFALRPLEMISRQLDRMTFTPEEAAAAPKKRERGDEYGEVSSKVDRIGRQMRDVQEVFTALKDNLDQIMANLQDGIMLFTREAKAVLVSASVESFLVRPRRELLGFSVSEIFHTGLDSSPLDALVINAFREHQSFQNLEIESRGGKRVLASLDFIEEGGERLGALLTLRDAESVRKIEDELEISRRLSAIGRLTSGVAHEVKNPINAIVVHLEVLRQKLQELPPDTRRHMDIISNEIRRLDRVVHTLVEFYRPVELKRSEFDLNRLIEDVVMLAKLEAASHGHYVEVHLSPKPLVVRADYDMLKQSLLNIVLNGLQAMEGQARSTLAITATETHDRLGAIKVRDEGPGIPPEIQDKIYNLYFTTKPTGSGIGLAMTYRIMQLHSGSLTFKTSERGTEFTMELPLAEESERSLESAKQETA
jgi:signal transduction histidine kinase